MLSAGEVQLINIARVMLLNPPILILDEATSNIDLITENKIQKAFETLISNSTSFIISCGSLLLSLPRTYGTMQYVQKFSQPSSILTKALVLLKLFNFYKDL